MREEKARITTIISFVINLFLTIIKIVVGIVGYSGALVADGIHSLSDLITDIIVFVSIKLSSKPADEDHNYGHYKIETVATFILCVALFIAGFSIAKEGFVKIIGALNGEKYESPTIYVLIVAALSLVVKWILYKYTLNVGKKIKSDLVIANANHQKSDSLSSIAVLIGSAFIFIFGASFWYFDAIASIIVSLFIFYASYHILIPTLNQLTEKAIDSDQVKKIDEILNSHDKVKGYHRLKTRQIGNHVAIDVHIFVDASLNIKHAHDITQDIENKLTEIFGNESLIYIHIEPYIKAFQK